MKFYQGDLLLQFRGTCIYKCNEVNPINKPPIVGDGLLFGLPNHLPTHLATGSCSMHWRSLLVPRTSRSDVSMIKEDNEGSRWIVMDMGIGQEKSMPNFSLRFPAYGCSILHLDGIHCIHLQNHQSPRIIHQPKVCSHLSISVSLFPIVSSLFPCEIPILSAASGCR